MLNEGIATAGQTGARGSAADLKAVPLFAELDDKLAADLGARCRYVNYEPDETIVDHADPSTEMRFVISGDVRVLVRANEGREYIMNDGGPGDFFGEVAAIDGGARSATVVAITKVRCCLMPAAVFREAIDRDHHVRWRTMERLANLVRRLSDKVTEYSFLQAKHRVYIELQRLSRPRKGAEKQRSISPPNTSQ